MKKTKRFTKIFIALTLVISSVFTLASCDDYVEKSELGLNFVIPDDYEREYNLYGDIEYGNGETAFIADVIPYSEYNDKGITKDSGILDCTKAIIDTMELGNVQITYNESASTAQFDTWVSDGEQGESFYNYIVILLGENNIYVVRYVCAGTEKEMDKHKGDFAEMASHLSVKKS